MRAKVELRVGQDVRVLGVAFENTGRTFLDLFYAFFTVPRTMSFSRPCEMGILDLPSRTNRKRLRPFNTDCSCLPNVIACELQLLKLTHRRCHARQVLGGGE